MTKILLLLLSISLFCFEQYALAQSHPFKDGLAELSVFSEAEERPPISEEGSPPFKRRVLQMHAGLLQTLKHSDYPFVEQEDPSEEQNLHSSLLIDMETMVRDFILETKKIEFPEYPGAFNPSIIKWNGFLLMSFRIYKPQNKSTNPFALVRLNENFEPIS